ncbi:MAG TPA: TPM domain-containing protein [Blastocatellia bacterium]|nr:TPM domain-containing protein [Blastocatellia bacterium]
MLSDATSQRITLRRAASTAALMLALVFVACRATPPPIAESHADSQSDLPKPLGLVSDFAGKLSAEKKSQLETLLKTFAERGGIDFAVVTIPYEWLKDEAIESYSLRLGQGWGVGRGSQKLGLLLLVAIKGPGADGLYRGGTRLEVSRKLESDMTNEQAGEIIRKMRDDFQQGRFDQAVTVGVQLIVSTLAQKRGFAITQ